MFGKEMAMNQTCYALVPTAGAPYALYCLLKREIDRLVHAAHGSVFDTITTATFEQSKVILADATTLAAFESIVSAFFRRILIATAESRSLAYLRDTLLPKLISGELRVQNAEKFVGAIG